MSSLSNKQVKRKGVAATDKNKRNRIQENSDEDDQVEQTQPISSEMEVDDREETTPHKEERPPPLERRAPGAPEKEAILMQLLTRGQVTVSQMERSGDNEVHRTDDAESNRNLLDTFNKAAAEESKPVIDEETKELVRAALPFLSDDYQARLKAVFLHRKINLQEMQVSSNGERILVQEEIVISDAQVEEVKQALKANPASVKNLLETYSTKAKSILRDDAAKPVMLNDDLDAAMAEGLDQTEKQLEEASKQPPAADIFTTAEEMDIAYQHNLYFENPLVRDSVISFKPQYSKKTNKTYENFKLNLPEGKYQRFLDDVYYSLALITPPGLMELVNLPPFGNISEFIDSTKKKQEGKEVSKYAPKFYSECKWSLNYTSKHFYHDTDKDSVEYDERTRRAYQEMKEVEAKVQYMEAHPDCKSEYEVPLEAYEWKQEQALNPTQLAELSDTERFAKNSKTVMGHFYFLRTQIEDMYQELVKKDPGTYAPSFKTAIEKSIADAVKALQDKEEEAAKKEKRRANRIVPEKFEDVLNRNLKTLIKTDKIGGCKSIKFGGKLFQAATAAEKKGLQDGIIKFDNEAITKICRENGLMPKHLKIYRLLTEEEMNENPTADALHQISEAEANAYVRMCQGKIIGQMVYSPGPMLISPEQMIYYTPKALIVWGPGNAYREPFQFQKAPERPKVEKRIFAPAPTVVNNKKVDTSGFASMEVPEAFAYKKKEENNQAQPAAK